MENIKDNEEARKNIIDLLVDKGRLTKKNAQKARDFAAEQDLSIEKSLIKNKLIDEEELIKIRARELKIPYVDLREEFIPIKVLEKIPEEAAEHYKIISFFSDDEKIKVAFVDPEDVKASEALRFFAWQRGKKIENYICSGSSFSSAFSQYHIITSEVKKALEDIESVTTSVQGEASAAKSMEEKKFSEEAPVSKIVDMILRTAVEAKASDIHIEPTDGELRIRNRVDGVLQKSSSLPERLQPAVVSRIKILANLKIDEQRKPQDGRFQILINNQSYDFRVSTLPTANGEKMALRILDKSSGIQNLENLGMGNYYRRIILENIQKPFGAILVSGPTGSGKSTTIYALLSILNQEGVNIITLEDPVEYYLSGVNQSQIRPEIGYTFASGLRSILRQDPDIITVGEIRDSETAELVVHAALTGHLVLSTIHTNNAAGVIPRLIDMGVEPFLISSSMNLAMAQRLVKRICPYCRKEYSPTAEIEKIILEEIAQIPAPIRKETGDFLENRPIKVWRGEGCKRCRNKGTKGRIGLFEMIVMTKELGKIILENPNEQKIQKEARRQNMISMRQAGIIKALRGDALIEEVLEVSVHGGE
jgi:type IV pilus assembly protein PilB